MKKFKDLAGKKFGRLTVVSEYDIKNSGRRWLCKCDCGIEKPVLAYSLINGLTKSCGCYCVDKATEDSTTHGMFGTKEYGAWQSMKNRCHNPASQDAYLYSEKGVIVCDRWRYSFENFFADMGFAPSPKHSVDRYPNRRGNYEPGNVRWATQKEQSNNTERNVFIDYKGETLTRAQWSERFKFSIHYFDKAKKQGNPLVGVLHKFDPESVYVKEDWEKEKPFDVTKGVNIEYKGAVMSLKTWASVLGINYKHFHKLVRYKNMTIQDILDKSKAA